MRLTARDLLNTARTTRYHTVPSYIHKQDVAQHSWGVATLIAVYHPNPSPALLKAALFHDLGESKYGDIPATAKWADKELSRISDKLEVQWLSDRELHVGLIEPEFRWLKACDLLEGYIHCFHHSDEAYRTPSNNYRDAIRQMMDLGTWPEELRYVAGASI